MADRAFEFRSLPGLWQEYDEIYRPLAFDEMHASNLPAWQKELKAALWSVLGVSPAIPCDLAPQVMMVEAQEDFTVQKVVIQTQPGEHMPCYVLVPHDKANRMMKPVIALPGHGCWGVRALISTPEDPAGAELNRTLNYDYAAQLARRGYLVFAPELRGLGERMEVPPYQNGEGPEWLSSCRAVSLNAMLMGKTLLGLRVMDVIRLIDYIQTRADADRHKLGCVGFSGGGTVALFASALDRRITCSVVSGYFSTFRDSIMSIRHCLCNVVPGLACLAEMVDIAGLIAPRPLFIESGIQDPLFPQFAVKKALSKLRLIYQLFEAGDKLDSEFFEGGHCWNGVGVYPWLDSWMEA